MIARLLATLARRFPPHVRVLVRLAWPVVLAELGWMGMGVVDTLMVRHLGPSAIGAVGVGSNGFMGVAIFGMGLLLGLDPLVAQAFGARRLDECHRWLWHGVALAVAVTVPTQVALAWLPDLLRGLRLHDDVLPLAQAYVRTVNLSLLPLLIYATARRYLQAMGVVRPVMIALVSANLLNVVANWVLINGRLGIPAFGVEGAAWATVVSRTYMATMLCAAIVLHDRDHSTSLWTTPRAIVPRRMFELVRLGLPAAVQLTLEVGVFATATLLVARLPPVSLAAHHIALNLWSLTFMVPLGVSSAAAVLVGHAVGRRDGFAARQAGWTALAAGSVFMTVAAVVFLTLPRVLIGLFTPDTAVVATGATLLMVCAVFQFFDGLQVVATGALRGLGETRAPMFWNLGGHWAIGLPLGYALCFWFDFDVVGLWIGLSAGLLLVGAALLVVWARRARHAASAWPVANGAA